MAHYRTISQHYIAIGLLIVSNIACYIIPTATEATIKRSEYQRVRFDNYHVYRLHPQTATQLKVLQYYDGQDEAILYLDAVHNVGAKINVLVSPERVPSFEAELRVMQLNPELLERNAQTKLETQDERIADSNRRTDDYTWDEYHELNDTYRWLYKLESQFPKNVKVFVAGQTYEGREILGVHVAYEQAVNGQPKKAIFLEGGMHAREWIGPATTTYILNQLLSSDDHNVRVIAENYDWYIVPHANPDGFVFTHTTNRLWRKTRTPYGQCYGADPNRNWDFHWNEVGASNLACSDTYAGPTPFSEIETHTLSNYIATLKGRLLLYISYHSYSQLLLFPYGHTNELPPNYGDLKRVYDNVVQAISRRHGTKYTGGNVYDAIYPAAGASLDWVYGALNVQYSYCFELRPPNYAFWYGFRLPADQIIPTGEETLDALVEMVKEIGIRRG